MIDKLTAAGIKTPWPLKMHRRLTYMDASPELRLKWASKAIDALVDLLVQTTRELRLSNRMHAKLTDKHTEALMRAEKAMTALDELREMMECMIVCEDDPYVVDALTAVLMCIDVAEARHSQEDDHGAV